MESYRKELRVPATVRPVEATEFDGLVDRLVTAGLEQKFEWIEADLLARREARPAPIIDGHPRMLHVTAWIAHEGTNCNGVAFIAEELEAAVKERRLFQGPYAGIIDFNHDLQPRGYWYDAEYAYDPKAKKYGIIAHGAVWAWRFPELADAMLAEQSRSGKIEVSMALLAPSSSIEYARDEEGRFIEIVHDPVFVAASLLDEPPADPFAEGRIDEDPERRTKEERQLELLRRASLEEEKQMEDVKTVIVEALNGLGLDSKLEDAVTRLTAALEAKAEEFRATLAERETQVAELTDRAEAAEARVAELEAVIEEKEIAISAMRDEKAAVDARLAELEAEISAVREAEAARQFEVIKEARLNELPEAVRARVLDMPEEKRERMLTRWASQSDEEWALTKEEFETIGATVSQPRTLPGLLPDPHSDRVDLRRYIRD